MRVGMYLCGDDRLPVGSPVMDTEIAADGNGVKLVSDLAINLSAGNYAAALRFTNPVNFVMVGTQFNRFIDDQQRAPQEFRTPVSEIAEYAALPDDPGYVVGTTGNVGARLNWPCLYQWEVQR